MTTLTSQPAWVGSSNGLRQRYTPRISDNVMGVLRSGALLDVFTEVTYTADSYDWLLVKSELGFGFVAKQYLLLNLPQPKPVGSAIGVHIAYNGDKGDIEGVAARLASRNKPLPLIVVVTDAGLANRLKEITPATTIVYRYQAGVADPSPFGATEGSAGWRNGAEWFDELWQQHRNAPLADFHQMYNEVSFANNVQSEAYARKVNQFELELMRRANERGVKVTIGNYMPGVPEKRHIDQLRPALAFAEQHGHALCYHAYTNPNDDSSFTSAVDYYALRWVKWLEDFPKLRVILGEAGYFNSPRFRGVAALRSGWQQLDDVLRPYRQAGRRVDAAWWTIRGQNDDRWRYDDFTPHLNELEAYHAA